MWLLLGFYVFGVVVGCVVTRIIIPCAGKLNIDQSNPEKDIYQFEMNMPIEKLPKQTWIRLKIDPNSNLSSGGITNGRDYERSIF